MNKSLVEIHIPQRKPGRQSVRTNEQYYLGLIEFSQALKEIQERVGFKMSARGWCYILEAEAGLSKAEFNKAESVINECRRSGYLPIDFTAADKSRKFSCIQYIGLNPEAEADSEVERLIESTIDYTPKSFWENQEYYIQMLVEKIDLCTLFKPICQRYHIPIATARGWSDLNQRHDMMKRFKCWERKGKQCVLLYCGDFDPDGCRISDTLMKNMADLEKAAAWSPENVEINRFGLDRDFIDENGLTWIEGLKTSGGKDLASPTHHNHKFPYVQNWLRDIGPRKVEANALVVRSDEGRRLCQNVIDGYVHRDAPDKFGEWVKPYRDDLLNQVLIRLKDEDYITRLKEELS